MVFDWLFSSLEGACWGKRQGHAEPKASCSGSSGKATEPNPDSIQTRRVTSPIVPSHPLPSIMPDVEMKAADKAKGDKKDEKKEDAKEEEKKVVKPPPTPVAEIKSNVSLIERAVSTLEPRFTHRVLRTLTALRKRIDDKVLRDAIEELYPKGECLLVKSS